MAMRRVYKQGIETVYRGTKYRSRWEVYIAKLLLYSDTPFLYEPQRFFISPKLSYLPDFYLPSKGAYLEVKGALSYKDRILLSAFSRTNKLRYVGKAQIEEFHGDKVGKLFSKDIVQYTPTKTEISRFMKFLDN